jgi:cation:H+ antiporter
MIGGADLFIANVTSIADSLRVPALVLSLIITPIATELPEKFNSVTWIRQKKDTLALGNISGAMVFQSSVTPAIGIFFTPWVLNASAIASIAIAVVATSFAWAEMTYRRRISPYALVGVGALYALYPLTVFWLFPMLKAGGYSWFN